MSVQGSTIFSDPNATEWIVVAAEGRVFVTGENRVARELSLNGETLTGECSFTQTYDKLLLWRGTASAPLQLETFDGGFVAVTQTSSGAGEGTGTQVIPNSDGARFFQNRVFVPFIYSGTKKDFVAVGDIGNYTRYKFPQNAFRFNDGADDDIVDLAPFGRTSMAVFKQKSVRIVDNLVPDSNGDYSAAVSDLVTNTHGLVARGAWVAVGRDLFYVSTRGVTSLQLTEENRVKGVDLPLSAPLEATWNRINWRFRDKIRIGYWDNKLYVALPLDDARVIDTSANLATGTYNPATGNLSLTVTAGAAYYFAFGLNELTLTNSTATLTRSGFFTAETDTVVFNGTLSAACTATLNYVPFYNCNTAVAVYDFLTQAWAGVDQTDYVTHVKDFLTPSIQGKQRLVAVTEDGLLRLWEEGFEDERRTTVANAYVDITVRSQPATAKRIVLNTSIGDIIIASTAASVNSGTTWGTSTTALARTNLYAGYAGGWVAPGGTVTQQDWGIRWTSDTATLGSFSINSVTIKNAEREHERHHPRLRHAGHGRQTLPAGRRRAGDLRAHLQHHRHHGRRERDQHRGHRPDAQQHHLLHQPSRVGEHERQRRSRQPVARGLQRGLGRGLQPGQRREHAAPADLISSPENATTGEFVSAHLGEYERTMHPEGR